MVLVFDLDGVVYLGTTAIPGAPEALSHLARSGHRLFYLTNNSTRSRTHFAERLASVGVDASPDQIVTSAYATGLYLKNLGAAGRRVYVVGEIGLCQELEAAGLQVIDEADEGAVDYVVAGLNRRLTYDHLLRAHREISRGAAFIATNRDRTYPLETGEIPGGGAIVAPIETSTGVTGVTIGKPEPLCWKLILQSAGAQPGDSMMVGDRPETDIKGARAVGLHTVLVFSGVTTQAEAANLPPDQTPDYMLEGVRDLPRLVERLAPAPALV